MIVPCRMKFWYLWKLRGRVGDWGHSYYISSNKSGSLDPEFLGGARSCDCTILAPSVVTCSPGRSGKFCFQNEWMDLARFESWNIFSTRNIVLENSLSLLPSLFAVIGAVVLLNRLPMASFYWALPGTTTAEPAPTASPSGAASQPCQPHSIIG